MKIKRNDGLEVLPLPKNPDILIGENDLTSLSYLNEAEGSNVLLSNVHVLYYVDVHHNIIVHYAYRSTKYYVKICSLNPLKSL